MFAAFGCEILVMLWTLGSQFMNLISTLLSKKNKEKLRQDAFSQIKVLEGNVFYVWKLKSEIEAEKS
jgi:hypothetical protein